MRGAFALRRQVASFGAAHGCRSRRIRALCRAISRSFRHDPVDLHAVSWYNSPDRSIRRFFMVRRIRREDRENFLRLSEMFYASPAVLHGVPEKYHEDMFDELMRSDEYADGYILEADGKCVGYGLTAKSYSREAGGRVLWLEELFILEEYRSRGLGREFFPGSGRGQRARAFPLSAFGLRRPDLSSDGQGTSPRLKKSAAF